MKLRRFTVPALAILMGTGGLGMALTAGAQQGPPQGYYGQQHDRGDWDAPPREFNDIQRRGFHDGIEGARKDLDNHRRPDVENRDEYRHPNLPPELREQYREAFRRGYNRAMRHLTGGGPGYGGPAYAAPAPPPPPRAWDMAPDAFNDLQRRGFHDGIEGARKDFENHRRPDVENRDEYRHPDLSGGALRAYREGFRHGYAVGVRHIYGILYRDDHDRY
ncbi:MAG TPA: hypothetical protein VFU55_14180 [Terracidiphilus sp.]|nr:hypothetical protein [Terracidiphilus sp.]